jgi:hypothetical protein
MTDQSIPQILFKDYLNVPFNKVGNPFFNEDAPFSTYSVGDQVLIDPIPREPTFGVVACPYAEIAATEYETYEQDASGVLEKFTKLKLKQVDLIAGGSSAVRYLLDPSNASSLNILSNSLQFNYGLNTTTNYELYIDGTLVPRSNVARSYIFNFRAGYLTFYGTIPPTTTFTGGNVEFTFVRYRGRVGLGLIKTSPWVEVGSPVTGISYTAGNVGIGTSEPNASSALDVSGNLTVTGDITSSGDITGFSDVALKKNISPLCGSLEMVMSMRPVSYEMKTSSDGRRRVGFVAQEVERILPEVIHVSPHDVHGNLKSIAYGNLTSPIVGALQEVVRRMNLLDERLCGLEHKMQAASVTAASVKAWTKE